MAVPLKNSIYTTNDRKSPERQAAIAQEGKRMIDEETKRSDPPPAGRTLAKMTGGVQVQAIVPASLGEVFAMAEMVHKAGLAPNSVSTPQQLTIIFLKAMELGILPMAAMECIGIINGKACLYGDGIPSLLLSRGFKIREWYTDDAKLETTVAHCEITRPEGDKHEFAYSAKDARENGLWDPATRDEKRLKSPWQRYTKRMLKMRCRGWLARDCGADVLKGIPIYEEQADIQLSRGEYREVKQSALAVPDDIPDESATVAATVSEAEASQDEPIANVALYLQRLEEQLAGADITGEVFAEIVEAHEQLVEAGRLDASARVQAEVLVEKYSKRFG